MKTLKQELKATLANPICSAQALDEPTDRNRVLKEILKTIDKTQTWRCMNCGFETIWPYDKLASGGNPVCDCLGDDMELIT